MNRYYIIYKPFNVLCQFSPVAGKQTLKDHFNVEHDVYPVGRLDYDSEGLLILTNDKKLNHRLLDPKYKHVREYYVQADGAITAEAVQQLQTGVTISIDGKQHRTAPAMAKILTEEPALPERYPPVRFRKHIPTSWISLTLTEGKNRQVRKMTAATGFPTLRLVRFRIEKIDIRNMRSGDIRSLDEKEIYKLLFT